MRWPGRIPAGTETAEPLGTIDILPTFARLADAPLPPQTIDGRDGWPLISGKSGAKSPQETYLFYYENNELQALTSGRWKLQLPHTYRTLGNQPKATGGTPAKYRQVKMENPELYDLESDVGETKNVADQESAELSRLLAIAETARNELGDSLTKHTGSAVRPPGREPAVERPK
jgi:arylsulfatase